MQQVMICPKCGSQSSPGQGSCPSCGDILIAACPSCKRPIIPGAAVCNSCGASLSLRTIEEPLGSALTPVSQEPSSEFLNTSGQGSGAAIPPEIEGWNWGAFLFSWIWSLGNSVWIGLLALIPYVGFIMHFVLGVKGNKWAWENKKWDSVEPTESHPLARSSQTLDATKTCVDFAEYIANRRA